MRARLKSLQPCAVWQLGNRDMSLPGWVIDATTGHDHQLYLMRRSGKQLIRPGDWLIQGLDDDEPDWSTDADFRRDYEIINSDGSVSTHYGPLPDRDTPLAVALAEVTRLRGLIGRLPDPRVRIGWEPEYIRWWFAYNRPRMADPAAPPEDAA